MAKARPRKTGFPLESLATPLPPHFTGGHRPLHSTFSMQDPFRISRTGEYELLLFHHALQGVLVLAREIHHLRHLGLGDLVGEHAALPDSMMMDVEHDLGRSLDILV